MIDLKINKIKTYTLNRNKNTANICKAGYDFMTSYSGFPPSDNKQGRKYIKGVVLNSPNRVLNPVRAVIGGLAS